MYAICIKVQHLCHILNHIFCSLYVILFLMLSLGKQLMGVFNGLQNVIPYFYLPLKGLGKKFAIRKAAGDGESAGLILLPLG